MEGVQSWGGAITMSLTDMADRVIGFLPSLVGAILVFVLGWVIAVTVGKFFSKMMKALRVDNAAQKIGLGKLEDIGIDHSISELFGELIKWFLVLVFLMAETDILNLDQVTEFINSILLYLPNVVVAVVILSVVMLVGGMVYNIVKGSTRTAGIMSATLLATISKWAIILFGIFAALIQLGIASSLVSTIFIGIVAMLSIAGGLAFGLGGKEEAQMILRKLREEIVENKK